MRNGRSTVFRVVDPHAGHRWQPAVQPPQPGVALRGAVGVIAFDLAHPFAAEMLQVLYTACLARGYRVLAGTAEHDSGEGRLLSAILSAGRVDGLVLIGDTMLQVSDTAQYEETMRTLVAAHRHVVTIASRPSLAGALAVGIDNVAGVALALDHLAALGHRRIAYLRSGTRPGSWEDQQRLEAYRMFLSVHDLPGDPDLDVVLARRDVPAAQQALRGLCGLRRPPTALFVNSDATAFVVLKAALTAGLRVPEDLSIVGFDDLAYAALCTPGLTTVHQPIDAMGTLAAQVLLDRIGAIRSTAAGAPARNTVVLAPTLVCRESSGPPPRRRLDT